jgi:anti-anti-sigma factor
MEARELAAAVRRRNGEAVLDLVGDIDASAEAALQRAYEEAAGDARSIVLDFSGADYINSTGIALIVRLLADARARRIEMSACGLSDHYREIFEITRLADFMRIVDTTDGRRDRRGTE